VSIPSFRKNVDRHDSGTIDHRVVPSITAKNDDAVSCHTKNRGQPWISPRLDEEIKFRAVPLKVILEKLLFGIRPILHGKAMCTPTPFEKLVGSFGGRRENDLLVLVVSAFDRSHSVAATLSDLSVHFPSCSLHPVADTEARPNGVAVAASKSPVRYCGQSKCFFLRLSLSD
jgi:hypothetical protein